MVFYMVVSLFVLHEAGSDAELGECSVVEAPVGALSKTDYGAIVKYSDFRKAKRHKVVIVSLTSGKEPDAVLANVCAQRYFTSRLIKRLNDLGAAVIAFDKYYRTSSCEIGGQETIALADAIRTSHAVITRGLHTVNIPKESYGGKETCLQEEVALDLPIPPENSGLLRLDADTRRLPLGWPVLLEGRARVKWMETFAMATARVADPDAIDTFRLKRALASGRQPYSTMMKIPVLSALEILCGRGSNKGTNWQSCTTTEPWNDIHGATVVIGDHSGDIDKHPTVGGFLYGVDLQANYIAALLDERYYLPLLSRLQNEASIVAFFVILQILFWKCKSLLAGLLYGVMLWAGIFIASVIILAFSGYLLTVWVQGINLIAILVSFIEHSVARMK